MTKSKAVMADVCALLRARNPLLWVVTREEARVERCLVEAAASAGYMTRTWDVAQGGAEIDGSTLRDVGNTEDPGTMLDVIKKFAERSTNQERVLWVLRDLPAWLAPPIGITVLRKLRNLARSLPNTARNTAQAIVILSPSGAIPPELEGHATVIDWPLPDREEIVDILDRAIESLPEFEFNSVTKKPDPDKPLRALACPNGVRDAAIDAAVGLSGEEAQACYARSLVQLRRIDPATVTREKRRVIARERVLEWVDPLPGGLDAVGGLENLKEWLVTRKAAYSPKARAYGLPSPKGALLVGIPGCGKTLSAKATATAWVVPLLKVDLGALKSKYVGDSEQTIRKAFKVVEAIGRCVLWIDEIEKGLAGATGGAADGGVSADALGFLLNWMQERQGESFVIATANDVSALPPELLRKGRFDEMWFIDLPTRGERSAVLAAALRAHGRGTVNLDYGDIVDATENFSGAEIAALVPEAMFAAFADGVREIETADLLAAARNFTPSTVTSAEKIAKLREWSKTRARPATKADGVAAVRKSGRELDL